MSSNNSEKVLASIDNIKNYIARLLLSTKQAFDMTLNELEVELKSHKIDEPSGFPDRETISKYPYEYREAINALKIMTKIEIANGKNETNTTKYKDNIKELESKLIEIYNSVKLEA